MKYELRSDYSQMFEKIVNFTSDYLHENNIKTLVIGMSGGIDSTLCAALASEVCRPMSINVTIEGRILPIESDQTEISRAIMASKAFCDHFQLNHMTPTYTALNRDIISTMSSAPSVLIRRGNIKARLRMIKLYDLANKMDGIVLSTDNYTEYLLGFWTLHGDVGDYGMMQNLWKTEVYGLANYLMEKYKDTDELYKAASLQECIKAMPTDGLGISASDFDQIYPDYNKNSTPVEVYGKIDAILLDYLKNGRADYYYKVIKRHKATEFKRENPFNIPRESIIYPEKVL